MRVNYQIEYFDAKIYWVDSNELEEFVAGKLPRVDYEYWSLAGCRIIDNPAEDNKILVGDFKGNDGYYACSIRLFLYKDNFCLGKATYVPESNWSKDSIKAKFQTIANKIIVYGRWEMDIGSDYFVMELKPHVEVNETNNLISTQPPQASNLYPQLSFTENEDSAIFYAAFNLSRFGYQPRVLTENAAANNLSILVKGTVLEARVFINNKKKVLWNLSNISAATRVIILADLQDEEMYPDMYVITYSEWTKKFQKKSSISPGLQLQEFEEYWFDLEERDIYVFH
jgi:hypothetical protein